jgi:CRP-like cAMP-binding protein
MLTKDFLKSVDLFAALVPEDAEALAALAKEEVFAKGEAVFREREASGRIYVILSGVVEVVKSAPAGGRPYRLARLERGETLGEISTFEGGPRSATAQAAVVPETRLASWDSHEFLAFLGSRPRAATAILGQLVRKLGVRLRQTSDAVHTLLRALDAA